MEVIKALVYFFINSVLNRIPSRSLRMLFYHLISGRKISINASIGLGVKILDIRNVKIGDRTNVNSGSILDGRGMGIEIGSDVDIAAQVNVWSLEHDPKSPSHEARSGIVIIEDHVWIANRAILLPNTLVGAGSTIGAGSVLKGKVEKNTIGSGNPFNKLKERTEEPTFKLRKIRRFR